jgi:uncharacterized protein
MKGENVMNDQGKMDKFVRYIVRQKLKVLIILLLISAVFSLGAIRMKSEVILQHLFPYDHPYLKLQARFVEVFGSGGSTVAIAVKAKQGDIFNQKTLGKIKAMTDEIELWDEAYRNLTVSLSSMAVKVVKTAGGGEVKVDSLMNPDVPKDEKGMEELKVNIFSNPSYSGTLVSEDGTSALILTAMKDEVPYLQVYKKLTDLTQRYTDESVSIHIVGFPVLMGYIYAYKTQMYIVFAISIFCMLLILYLSFRHLLGMIAPIAVSAICTGLGLGFIGWTGINFSPLLYVLAFLVGARMVSNAVQITHRYCEEYAKTGDKEEATFLTTRAMWMPNVMAATTEMAGFMVLGIAKIVLMQQLAVIMGFWMATITLEGVLVPIICSYLPFRKDMACGDVEQEEHGPIARFSMALSRFSLGAGKYAVIAGVVFIILVGGWQMTKLKVGDATPGSPVLWEHHKYNTDQALMNEKFNASSEQLVLYWEGETDSPYDSAVVQGFEKFALHMAAELPDIYKTSSSIIDYSKAVNQSTFYEGDEMFYTMPTNKERLLGLIGQTRNTIGNAFARFIDGPLERAQITLFFADHTSDNLNRIRTAAYGFFKKNPMKLDRGEFKLAGGRIGMEMALNEEMKQSHARIDLMVLFAIFIMCVIAFRSFIAGLMLTVPLVLSNMIAFGYMSTMNIGLSANTLPCSAIGVGVGVDFAIYLYSRCKEEYPNHRDYRDTVMHAVRTTGEAIIFTGITLILPIITWYFISGLKFQAEMGFFLSMLLLTNMLTCLTVHPLMLVLIKPRFIRRDADQKIPDAVIEAKPAK